MLKMRLQRYGRKNDPSFRVVVTDSRNSPKTGNHVDVLGSYNPKGGEFKIDGEKAKHWISKGVQTSDTIHNFLVTQKIIEGKKINVLPRKTPVIDEAKVKAEAEAKAAKEAEDAKPKEEEIVAEEVTPETPTEEVKSEEVPAEEKTEPEAAPAEPTPETTEETK